METSDVVLAVYVFIALGTFFGLLLESEENSLFSIVRSFTIAMVWPMIIGFSVAHLLISMDKKAKEREELKDARKRAKA